MAMTVDPVARARVEVAAAISDSLAKRGSVFSMMQADLTVFTDERIKAV